MSDSIHLSAGFLAAILSTLPVASQGFGPGDLYFASPNLTTGTTAHGIVHIDPSTGASTRLVTVARVRTFTDDLVYDTFRDALVFTAKLNSSAEPWSMHTSDAQGNVSSMGLNQEMWCLAPTGDGRIYARRSGDPTNTVSYIDANNQLQFLMDASGSQRFEWASGIVVDTRQMTYDAPTRSLIGVTRSSVGSISCSGGTVAGVVVRRVALSADGSRAIGPVQCTEFNASESSEVPVGLSLMDDGDLLLVLDTNRNQEEPRMVRLDPATLAMTPFATNGYPGAAATTAGTWSSRLGKAVILDASAPTLRAYGAGQSGLGTAIPTTFPLVSANGTVNSLVEVRGGPCAGGFAGYGSGLTGAGGFEPTLGGRGCPVPASLVSLDVGSVVGGAGGVFLLGATPAAIQLFGGTLLVAPSLSVPVVVGGTSGAPGAGFAELSLGISPTPAFSGTSIYFQAVFFDAAAPFGLSFTSGLRMVIG